MWDVDVDRAYFLWADYILTVSCTTLGSCTAVISSDIAISISWDEVKTALEMLMALCVMNPYFKSVVGGQVINAGRQRALSYHGNTPRGINSRIASRDVNGK